MATQSNSSKKKTAAAGNSGKPEPEKKDFPLESWVMSTAACFHVTPHREILENYTGGDFGKVYTATNSSMNVVGKGDVRIKLSSGATWILRDVRHIPNVAWNMISVSQLCDKEYELCYSKKGWEVSHGDFAFTSSFATVCGITYLSTTPA